jgi:hypothetical protein
MIAIKLLPGIQACAEHTLAVAQANGTFLDPHSETCQVQKLALGRYGYALTRIVSKSLHFL